MNGAVWCCMVRARAHTRIYTHARARTRTRTRTPTRARTQVENCFFVTNLLKEGSGRQEGGIDDEQREQLSQVSESSASKQASMHACVRVCVRARVCVCGRVSLHNKWCECAYFRAMDRCLGHAWMGERVDGWMDGWIRGWMDGWTDGWTDG